VDCSSPSANDYLEEAMLAQAAAVLVYTTDGSRFCNYTPTDGPSSTYRHIYFLRGPIMSPDVVKILEGSGDKPLEAEIQTQARLSTWEPYYDNRTTVPKCDGNNCPDSDSRRPRHFEGIVAGCSIGGILIIVGIAALIVMKEKRRPSRRRVVDGGTMRPRAVANLFTMVEMVPMGGSRGISEEELNARSVITVSQISGCKSISPEIKKQKVIAGTIHLLS
jgi:hypothetical protein